MGGARLERATSCLSGASSLLLSTAVCGSFRSASDVPHGVRKGRALFEADRFDDLLDFPLLAAGGLPDYGFDEEARTVHIDDPYPDRVAVPRRLPQRTDLRVSPAVEEPRVAADVLANGERYVLRGAPPRVTFEGPVTSSVPGAVATAAARSAADEPTGGLHRRAHGSA